MERMNAVITLSKWSMEYRQIPGTFQENSQEFLGNISDI